MTHHHLMVMGDRVMEEAEGANTENFTKGSYEHIWWALRVILSVLSKFEGGTRGCVVVRGREVWREE